MAPEVADRDAQLASDVLVGGAACQESQDSGVHLGGPVVLSVPWHFIGEFPLPFEKTNEPGHESGLSHDQSTYPAVTWIERNYSDRVIEDDHAVELSTRHTRLDAEFGELSQIAPVQVVVQDGLFVDNPHGQASSQGAVVKGTARLDRRSRLWTARLDRHDIFACEEREFGKTLADRAESDDLLDASLDDLELSTSVEEFVEARDR